MTACSGAENAGSTFPVPVAGGQRAFSTASGSGFLLLHSFKSGKDGANPYAGLTAVLGTLYGTTSQGGAATTACGNVGCGTVFSLSASGKVQVLYRFKGGKDGTGPSAGLTLMKGVLYGTTRYGGLSSVCKPYGCGTVFAVSASGSERVVYAFRGGSDGSAPIASLVAVKGVLYGTTSTGGKRGNGTVFAVSASGNEHVLYSFKGGTDGANPYAGLVKLKGLLYGTTRYGGGYRSNCGNGSCGTVFSVSTTGQERVLHAFTGAPNDAAQPEASLIALNGVLYGTTSAGGVIPSSASYNSGYGAIFTIDAAGNEHVLYSFHERPGVSDGEVPVAALAAANGTLYGTTAYGGNGDGTVFQTDTSGNERLLHSFTLSDGATPVASVLALNGSLFGTTSAGGVTGAGGFGTIFKL